MTISRHESKRGLPKDEDRVLKDLEYIKVLLKRHQKVVRLGVKYVGDDIYFYDLERKPEDSKAKIARLTRLRENSQWRILQFRQQKWQRLPEAGNLFWCMDFIARDSYHLFF